MMIKKKKFEIEDTEFKFKYQKSNSNLNIDFNRISFIFFVFFLISLIFSIHLMHLGSRNDGSVENIKSVSYTKVLRLPECFLCVLAKKLIESLFNSSTLSRAFLSTHIIILCDSPISSAFY